MRTSQCLVLWWLLVGAATAAGAPVSVRDDVGRSVVLAEPARRIVSLAPHATELLFAAGAGDRVVGAVEYSDYPDAAKAVPRVGGYEGLDLEAVIALAPDLVVAWTTGNPAAQVQRLRDLGLVVFESEPRRISDIPDSLERLGRLAGTGAFAAQAAHAFRERYARLQRTYAGRAPVRVFYQIWDRPLMTVNGTHLISDVMRVCGARNVFAELPVLAGKVSPEAVIAADPEVIIASGMGARRPEWLAKWRRWPRLAAVQRDNLFSIPPELIQRHTPRLLRGAEQLCTVVEAARTRRPAGR